MDGTEGLPTNNNKNKKKINKNAQQTTKKNSNIKKKKSNETKSKSSPTTTNSKIKKSSDAQSKKQPTSKTTNNNNNNQSTKKKKKPTTKTKTTKKSSINKKDIKNNSKKNRKKNQSITNDCNGHIKMLIKNKWSDEYSITPMPTSFSGPVVRLTVLNDNYRNESIKQNVVVENNHDDTIQKQLPPQQKYEYCIVNKPKDDFLQQTGSSSTSSSNNHQHKNNKSNLKTLMNNIDNDHFLNHNNKKVNHSTKKGSASSTNQNAKSRRLNEAKSKLTEAGSEDKLDDWCCILCQCKNNHQNLGFLYGPYYWSNFEDKVDKGIHLPTELWIHEDCYIWGMPSPQTSPSFPFNSFSIEVLNKALITKCNICNKVGATICCSIHPCSASKKSPTIMVHYPCARRTGYYFNEEQFTVYCPKHSESYFLSSSPEHNNIIDNIINNDNNNAVDYDYY